MENPPFEDVFPIQDGDFPLLCLFTGGYLWKMPRIFQLWFSHPFSTKPDSFKWSLLGGIPWDHFQPFYSEGWIYPMYSLWCVWVVIFLNPCLPISKRCFSPKSAKIYSQKINMIYLYICHILYTYYIHLYTCIISIYIYTYDINKHIYIYTLWLKSTYHPPQEIQKNPHSNSGKLPRSLLGNPNSMGFSLAYPWVPRNVGHFRG